MPPVDPALLSAAATTFLDGMLKAAGLTGSVTVQQSGEDIDINVTGEGVSVFVGTKGHLNGSAGSHASGQSAPTWRS